MHIYHLAFHVTNSFVVEVLSSENVEFLLKINYYGILFGCLGIIKLVVKDTNFKLLLNGRFWEY